MPSEEVARFKALEIKLREQYPASIQEAVSLGAEIADPGRATVTEIWSKAWDKPLYSHTKVVLADCSISKLSSYMPGAWSHWGESGGEFEIYKTRKGSGTDSFHVVGPLAREVRAKTGIALHRLFAIQGAAIALRKRAAIGDHPYSDLVGADVEQTVPLIRSEMGAGWGHITVLHFLTDLGLAVKPDLHLVRAVRHLGMSLDLGSRQVPNFRDAIAINRRVRNLVEDLYGDTTPSRIRYVDKVLMDFSRRGLLDA